MTSSPPPFDKPYITHDLPTEHVAGFVSFEYEEASILLKLYAQTNDEYRKFACLLASAPEILKALKEARETIILLKNSRWSECEGSDEEWCAEIDSAIAKAYGMGEP